MKAFLRIVMLLVLGGFSHNVNASGKAPPSSGKALPSSRGNIQVVPVESTPRPEVVSLRIVFPKDGQVESSNPVYVQLRLRGYPLGTDSQFPRAKEIANSQKGQSIHVVIDDKPYFAIFGPSIDPFDRDGDYLQASYKFKLPYSLSNGEHIIRVFPCRSYGESLKGRGSFDARVFYMKDHSHKEVDDLEGPLLTYNEPSDQIRLVSGEPVLLDFYLSNCELSSGGYTVKMTVDKDYEKSLDSWQPYYIYGLTTGRHTIELELLDPDGKQVPGSFNKVKRTFLIHGS